MAGLRPAVHYDASMGGYSALLGGASASCRRGGMLARGAAAYRTTPRSSAAQTSAGPATTDQHRGSQRGAVHLAERDALLGEQTLSLCRAHECQPKIACRSAQIATVQALIALGQGVSLLPDMACRADQSKQLVYRTLANEKSRRTIAVVWHRHSYQSLAAECFLASLREWARQSPCVWLSGSRPGQPPRNLRNSWQSLAPGIVLAPVGGTRSCPRLAPSMS